jgi:acyl-[acyl-carrier-protein]-phospholipid O-acyltransferase / long-chain-fatty-acid--[acyl-carrier-protein] ligase
MSTAPEDASIAPLTDDGRGGVYSRSFLALVATQFFVSMNDNIFRWLVMAIGKEVFHAHWKELPKIVQDWVKDPESMALALGLASFTLPFMVFAAPAGYFADRFSKRRVMVVCKVIEFLVIGLGVFAIVHGNMILLFLSLFILGGQAMMFITSKFGAIPEIVRQDKISEANGLINMVSMSAIIIGGVIGNFLYSLTEPAGQNRWWISAAALFGVATCGLITSLFVGRLRAANPARTVPWNPIGQTYRDLRQLWSKRSMFLAALGSAYFWALGALSQLNIDQFGTKHLLIEQKYVGPLLAALTIGIGIGAVVAGKVSRNKVELGLVPLGGMGIALSSMLMFLVPGGAEGHPSFIGYGMGSIFLLGMGATAGLYDIPLQAFLQERSPVESRGSIMAAYNFLSFFGMLSASVVYWLLSGPLGLPSGTIFLVGGLATVLVTIMIVRLLPFHTTRLAMKLLMKCVYRIRLEGLENVPATGALVVSNHISWADGVLLGLCCPRHPRIVAFAEYFDSPWLGWFGRLGKIIPIGTTRKSMVESIRASREALQQGELVCIFPEGGISRSGNIEDFRPGFLSILKDSDAPVVPVYLGGLWGSIFSFEGGKFFWKWPRRWRYRITIRFGQPIPEPKSVEEVRQAVVDLQNDECKKENEKRKLQNAS